MLIGKTPQRLAAVSCAALLVGLWTAGDSRAQSSPSSDKHDPLVGGWTRSEELSDRPGSGDPAARDGEGHDGERGEGRGREGGHRGGGGFRGGFGGGRPGGEGGGGAANKEAMARMRDAMRDLQNPPDHLVIVDTGTIVILTGPDGRTLRLSTDGKKIKDENTGIERKTKWEGGRLVSEITGAGPDKMVQTFSVDPERHQLAIALQRESGRSGQPQSTKTVYLDDAR